MAHAGLTGGGLGGEGGRHRRSQRVAALKVRTDDEPTTGCDVWVMVQTTSIGT
jgi:hypothetical protein